MFEFSKQSEENMEGVDPRLKAIAHKALGLSPIDFGIPGSGGLRTEQQQHELYLAGKSQLDGRLKLSKHQTGLALDFYAYVDGRASWQPQHLTMVAAAFLQAASLLGYRLTWGGLWKTFIDMPHVQLEAK